MDTLSQFISHFLSARDKCWLVFFIFQENRVWQFVSLQDNVYELSNHILDDR